MSLRQIVALLVFGFTLSGATASAQPLGSFSWQLQPYCNVITVNVTQQAGIYTLDGTDTRCSATQAASVVGIAFMHPNGTVGFGLTEVLPGGTPVHIEATIDIASLSGTWRDSAGNSGAFVFTPGPPVAGSPRPVPSGGIAPASITNIQIANNAVSGDNIINGTITTVDILDAPRSTAAGGDQLLGLTVAPQIVRSVSVTAPAAGRINVIASGFFSFNNNAVADAARCSITTGTTLDSAAEIIAAENSNTAVALLPFAATRSFAVAAGTHTVNLVCDLFAGAVNVGDSQMVATFVANTP